MNAENRHQFDEALEAYLDGLPPETPKARDELRRRIEADPRVRAELERQAALDASLKRLFQPPAEARMPATETPPTAGEAEAEASAAPQRRPLRAMALAAIILICLGYAAWTLVDYFTTPNPYDAVAVGDPALQKPTTFVEAYSHIVSRGFKPDWICATDAEFRDTFDMRLGQGLLFEPDPPAATMAGLSYAHVLSGDTIVFLGRARGREALVFVDHSADDGQFELPADSDLHLFRRQIDGLVLYELTPLDEPMLLAHFHLPDDAGSE